MPHELVLISLIKRSFFETTDSRFTLQPPCLPDMDRTAILSQMGRGGVWHVKVWCGKAWRF